MQYRHPANNYTESLPGGWAVLWTFLFGAVYLAIKGLWGHALTWVLLFCVFNVLVWFVYPWFVPSIIERSYARKGWVQCN